MHSRSSRRASSMYRNRVRSSSGPRPTSVSPTAVPSRASSRIGSVPRQCSGSDATQIPLESTPSNAESIGETPARRLARQMVPSAFLRVYQPLDAFERSEQLHWERFVLNGPEASSRRLRYADHPTVGKLGVLAPANADSADVLHLDGRTLISPRRMRMRVLAAMVSFREMRSI